MKLKCIRIELMTIFFGLLVGSQVDAGLGLWDSFKKAVTPATPEEKAQKREQKKAAREKAHADCLNVLPESINTCVTTYIQDKLHQHFQDSISGLIAPDGAAILFKENINKLFPRTAPNFVGKQSTDPNRNETEIAFEVLRLFDLVRNDCYQKKGTGGDGIICDADLRCRSAKTVPQQLSTSEQEWCNTAQSYCESQEQNCHHMQNGIYVSPTQLSPANIPQQFQSTCGQVAKYCFDAQPLCPKMQPKGFGITVAKGENLYSGYKCYTLIEKLIFNTDQKDPIGIGLLPQIVTHEKIVGPCTTQEQKNCDDKLKKGLFD